MCEKGKRLKERERIREREWESLRVRERESLRERLGETQKGIRGCFECLMPSKGTLYMCQ